MKKINNFQSAEIYSGIFRVELDAPTLLENEDQYELSSGLNSVTVPKDRVTSLHESEGVLYITLS